ncbi:hypothetical protein GCM10010201_33680 [Pilimelia columellifera subsp. columellifera]|uniref:Carbamoyltransferase domain-containing protein n=1 Tax=Pilimelia columellifera subsp. columellifera TaxID=706583 RepID=A0ABN3NQT7_9ACTN
MEIVDHHLSHAASAYYFSGFERSAVLTVDAVGEWATSSWGLGDGATLSLLEFPHSLGLLYSAITGYLGFEVNEGEYKVMGLAPYGTPRYADKIRKLVNIDDSGRFTLDLDYFAFDRADGMLGDRFTELLGVPKRTPESRIDDIHCDIARSIQLVTEETLLRMVDRAHRMTGSENLCMAAAWRSTWSPYGASSRRVRSRTCSCSLRQVTLAAAWAARPWPISVSPANDHTRAGSALRCWGRRRIPTRSRACSAPTRPTPSRTSAAMSRGCLTQCRRGWRPGR